MSNRWRAWSTFSGSLLLHGAVLALVFAGRTAGDDSNPAARETQSPFGPSESAAGVLLEASDPAGARQQPIPIELEDGLGGADPLPEEPASATKSSKDVPEPLTNPGFEPSRNPATRREPPTKKSAEAPPSPTTQPAEPESPYTEGEDWLGIGDEVSQVPSGAPARTEALQSTPVGRGPSTPAEEVERDPLIQRLLAAETRKAAARESKVGDPEQQAAQRPRRPAAVSPAAEPSMAGVTDLPVGLARWLSYQAHAAPEWDHVALGDSRVSFRVLLRDGRIQSREIVGKPPERMARAIEAAFFHLRNRQFSGGTVHSAQGEVRLDVRVRVTQLSRKNAQPGDTELQQDTTPSGRYLPSARVLRPSLRRVELRVDLAD